MPARLTGTWMQSVVAPRSARFYGGPRPLGRRVAQCGSAPLRDLHGLARATPASLPAVFCQRAMPCRSSPSPGLEQHEQFARVWRVPMASASSLPLTTSCTVGSAPPVGSAEFFADPYPTYRLLREQGPIVRLGANMLASTRYADCLALLRDPRLSARRYLRPVSHYTAAEQSQLATWIRIASNQVIFMDPPEHTRLRNLLMRAFSPEAIERLIPRIGALFAKLLNAIPRCTEIDFMSRVAQRFPALVIGEVLGIPRSGWSRLLRWCDVFIEGATDYPSPGFSRFSNYHARAPSF